MKTTKELKDAIIKAGFAIERISGNQYYVIDEFGKQRVRFSNATEYAPAQVFIYRYDSFSGEEYWTPRTLEGFLNHMDITKK